MILTDATGKPFPRPSREDYPNVLDYIRAFHAYKDAIADCANKSFDKAIRVL